jgi:hypothetical protein
MKIEIKNGHVYKDGESIGTIDLSRVILSKSVGPTVKAAIKRETGDSEIKFEIAEDAPETETQSEGETVVIPAAPLTDAELMAEMQKRGLLGPVVSAAPVEAPQFDSRILDKQQILARLAEIEAPPVTLPDMGDKTPDYVAWIRRNATDREWNFIFPAQRATPSLAERDEGARKLALRKLPNEVTDMKGDNA